MASFDYNKTVATAQRLITKFGRSVTFCQPDVTPPDANAPWKTSNAVSGETQVALDIVAVQPSSLEQLGISVEFSERFKRSDQVFICAPGTNNMENFASALDNSLRWEITHLEILKPATTVVLAFIGVKR